MTSAMDARPSGSQSATNSIGSTPITNGKQPKSDGEKNSIVDAFYDYVTELTNYINLAARY